MTGVTFLAVALLASGGSEAMPATVEAGARPCMRAKEAVLAGSFPLAASFEPAPCTGDEKAAFRYDRSAKAAVAVRDIATAETVSSLEGSVLAGVRPGQTLYLSARVGVVTVYREVRVVQAALPGRPVFVKGSDGEIFSVPYPASVQ